MICSADRFRRTGFDSRSVTMMPCELWSMIASRRLAPSVASVRSRSTSRRSDGRSGADCTRREYVERDLRAQREKPRNYATKLGYQLSELHARFVQRLASPRGVLRTADETDLSR